MSINQSVLSEVKSPDSVQKTNEDNIECNDGTPLILWNKAKEIAASLKGYSYDECCYIIDQLKENVLLLSKVQ